MRVLVFVHSALLVLFILALNKKSQKHVLQQTSLFGCTIGLPSTSMVKPSGQFHSDIFSCLKFYLFLFTSLGAAEEARLACTAGELKIVCVPALVSASSIRSLYWKIKQDQPTCAFSSSPNIRAPWRPRVVEVAMRPILEFFTTLLPHFFACFSTPC